MRQYLTVTTSVSDHMTIDRAPTMSSLLGWDVKVELKT
jgi:hypothetical protein